MPRKRYLKCSNAIVNRLLLKAQELVNT